MQAIFERLAAPGQARDARARPSRSSTASPQLARHQRPPAPQGRQPALGRAGRRRSRGSDEEHVRDRRTARSGKGQPCYVIAEAGVNHNCDVQLGYRLIETAGAAGRRRHQVPELHRVGKISTRVAPRYWVEPAGPPGHAVGHLRQAGQAAPSATSSRCSGHARQRRASPPSRRRSTTRRWTSWPRSTCRRSRSPPPTSPATASSSARRASASR